MPETDAIFSRIYDENVWSFGSGEGSIPIHTRGYVKFLERFVQQYAVRSIVDLGCGDWQFSRFISWNGASYLGLNVVPRLISDNKSRFRGKNVSFALAPADLSDLPVADLLIIKDVLQHWSNRRIRNFVPLLERYKFSLITNCVLGATNQDIETGSWRPIDLRLPPFCLEAKEIYSFTNYRSLRSRLFGKDLRWRKVVLLVTA